MSYSEAEFNAQTEYLRGLVKEQRERAEKAEALMTAAAQQAPVTENDLYYLRSIQRQLETVKGFLDDITPFSIGGLAFADNVNWLDCFIDAHERALAAQPPAAPVETDAGWKFAKELSDALLKVRPLGGSEMFVQRNGQYYADPHYCGQLIEQLNSEHIEAIKDRVRAQKSVSRSSAATDELPEFEDPRVQIVYEALCDADLNEPPNCEEHWEGWVSRNIVKRLMPHLPQRAPEQKDKT